MHRLLKAALAAFPVLSLTFPVLFLLTSCLTMQEKSTLEVQMGTYPDWEELERLEILQMSGSGKVLDTLYRGPVLTQEYLNSVTVEKDTGLTTLVIKGYLDGTMVFEQKRIYDGGSLPDSVSTRVWLLSVSAKPENLLLVQGSEGAVVRAVARPRMAGNQVRWSLSPDDLAALAKADSTADTVDEYSGSLDSAIRVRPLNLGEATLTLRHPLDTSKTASVNIRIVRKGASAVALNKDSLRLFVGGPGDTLRATVLPAEANQELAWTSSDPSVATVDSNGAVKPVKAGSARIIARSLSASQADSAEVAVIADVPSLEVSMREVSSRESQVEFLAKSTQEFGHIAILKWDLAGDGTWDDSLTGKWPGREASFGPIAGKYQGEGHYSARFLVRDGEGHEAGTQVPVVIGNQAPEIRSIRADTVISIRDSVTLGGTLSDTDGYVAKASWDYTGDGVSDDSASGDKPVLALVGGHRYPVAGDFLAILRGTDNWGKMVADTVRVKVVLDPPVADIGSDTTVVAETSIRVSLKGSDGFGSVVSRELKVNAGPYVRLTDPEIILTAPLQAGTMICVGRVTDDDGLTDEDTMVVTVSALPKIRLTGAAGPGGSVTPDSAMVDPGAAHVFRIVPDATHRIASLTDNGADVLGSLVGEEYRIPAVASTHHVAAGFMRQFRINDTAGSGGTFDIASRKVDSGAGMAVRAVPNTGYRIDSLFVNGVLIPTGLTPYGNSYSHSITGMDRDYAVRAVFRKYYTLGLSIVGGGGVVSPISSIVDSAGTRTFILTPNSGHFLTKVSDGAASLLEQVKGKRFEGPCTLTVADVRKDYSIEVGFTRGVRIQINTDSIMRNGGSHTPPPRIRLIDPFTGETLDQYNYELTVPMGTSLSVESDSEWLFCRGGPCTSTPFKYWSVGGTKVGDFPAYVWTPMEDLELIAVFIEP